MPFSNNHSIRDKFNSPEGTQINNTGSDYQVSGSGIDGTVYRYTKKRPSVEAKQSPGAENTVSKPTGTRACFWIPFPKEDKFVGRESVMASIDEKFGSKASHKHLRFALVGIGGIGARQRDPNLPVSRVYASDTARYEEDYKNITDKLNLLGRDDTAADIFRLVSGWLFD
ncbi:hypothetical protein BDV29DRAFT_152434 [Aspergillus leporis]|uniref:Uncharacterized protein n=1 Tax=Aspergillus leporis TaxID=41062 RepID=A0A5N5XDM5_9EURO|nr:hypothetical protein BDV29DRAFT_152434 [Aspergillus leporis]